MSVLTTSWNAHGARPIVVKEAQFVAQSLNDVWRIVAGVFNNHIVSRRHRSLSNVLRHHKEVIKETSSDRVIDNCTRFWVLQSVALRLNDSKEKRSEAVILNEQI